MIHRTHDDIWIAVKVAKGLRYWSIKTVNGVNALLQTSFTIIILETSMATVIIDDFLIF